MKAVRFETGKKLQLKNASGSSDFNALVGSINRIANRYNGNKALIVQDLRDIIPSEFGLGWGGSHIWCANTKGERVFIIEGY